MDSLWFTTRTGLFREGLAAWEAAADYAGPLSRLLARRHSWVSEADREDIVQEMLIEIQGSLAKAHDPARGKFRALLQTVLARRVADLARRKRPRGLSLEEEQALAAPPLEDDARALELEGALLGAVRAARDRLTQGKRKDEEALYALVDRLLHGRSDAEIARAEGISLDQAARRLERARAAILEALLERACGVAPASPAMELAVDALRCSLRRPREEAARLERLPAEARPEAIATLLGEVRAGLPSLVRGAEEELRRGLDLILVPVAAGEGGA